MNEMEKNNISVNSLKKKSVNKKFNKKDIILNISNEKNTNKINGDKKNEEKNKNHILIKEIKAEVNELKDAIAIIADSMKEIKNIISKEENKSMTENLKTIVAEQVNNSMNENLKTIVAEQVRNAISESNDSMNSFKEKLIDLEKQMNELKALNQNNNNKK